MSIQIIERDEEVELQGPGGSVTLQCACTRDAEEGNLDRVAVEWATRYDDPERGSRVVQVLYAYSHDSYDGTRTMVLEDGYVCAPVVRSLLAKIGADASVEDFVRAAAKSSANGDAIATLLTDSETVGDQLRGTEML